MHGSRFDGLDHSAVSLGKVPNVPVIPAWSIVPEFANSGIMLTRSRRPAAALCEFKGRLWVRCIEAIFD